MEKQFLGKTVIRDRYMNNKVVTAKYSLISFFPLNLMIQFSKMANLYFLLLTGLTFIPVFGGGNPIYMILPLSMVVGISMLKDIYEDYQRHKSDNEENHS